MADIKLKGNEIHTNGFLPEIGSIAPNFSLVAKDLSEKSINDYKGKNIVLNIFPSIDTPTCATSVRKFNAELNKLESTVVLCISADLPFAQARFCGAEGLENVVTLSNFRDSQFAENYGCLITDGPLKGLLSRAVVVIDKDLKVVYTEQVTDIVMEPDYDKALKSIN